MRMKDYPLSVLKDLQNLQREMKKLTFKNSDIIEEVKDEKYILYLRDKEHHPFFFSISNPNQSSNQLTYFNFTYLPQSDVTFLKASFNSDYPQIISNFEIWINFLRQYSSIIIDDDDFITKQYEEEIFQDFEIIDDDAYTHPFEHERQVYIYKLLSNIEIELEKQKSIEDVQNIIVDVQELKGTIQNLTKKIAIRKLSKILAKIKKRGLKLFQEILSETRKEIIKRAINGSFDGINSWIN